MRKSSSELRSWKDQSTRCFPEEGRRERLLGQAEELLARYPQAGKRSGLFGTILGVKDIFHADGFVTRAGSKLPPELFEGGEADCVTSLRQAGALVLGKTVTTEFASFAPGPTRNPHSLDHTPGGSSSGSAAAVVAGFCDLAFGSQTGGSISRPASFCGIYGWKPTYGRIDRKGVLLVSPSLDTLGLFARKLVPIGDAAALLCDGWRSDVSPPQPVLGVTEGPYLDQVTKEGRDEFESQVKVLLGAGYEIARVEVMSDIENIIAQHRRLMAAEMAIEHANWIDPHEGSYAAMTVALIREGQKVSTEELEAARSGRKTLRDELEKTMRHEGVDLWISPSAPGPAPEGIEQTGDPAMNSPWTHAGMPTMSIPGGNAPNGLPLGFQCAAISSTDEELLVWSEKLGRLLARP